MTPRPYQQSQRQASTAQTEARILKAARELLFAPKAGMRFSLDAVARRAKVTRRTVYLRAGSRRELIEAAFDSMAEKSGIREVGEAFQVADPLDAVMRAVDFFARFYTASRSGMRRVRAHAEFDPELAEAIGKRNERRRTIFRTLIQRLSKQSGFPAARQIEETVALVFAVTSFEMCDLLGGKDKQEGDVAAAMKRLVRGLVTA